MDNLKNHIGEEIIVTVSTPSGTDIKTGELRDVQDFISIGTNKWGLPFIGKGIAILKIATKSGEILFENPYLGEVYTLNDDASRFEMIKKLFGEEAAQSQVDRLNNWEGYDIEEEDLEAYQEEQRKKRM